MNYASCRKKKERENIAEGESYSESGHLFSDGNNTLQVYSGQGLRQIPGTQLRQENLVKQELLSVLLVFPFTLAQAKVLGQVYFALRLYFFILKMKTLLIDMSIFM